MRKKSKHGTGTLFRRGRVFIAQWMVDGKIYKRTTGEANRREAEKKLAEFTAPFRMGDEKRTLETLVARVGGIGAELQQYEDGKPAMTLGAAWTAYLESPRRSKRAGAATLDTYELQYHRFVDWMRKHYPAVKELRHVTEDHAAKFCAHLTKTVSANSFGKYVVLLRRVWAVVGKQARATVNPWQDVEKPPLDTRSRRPLTSEELDRIFNYVHGEMRILFFLGFYTGFRLGDAVCLRWDVIDMASGHFVLTPHKTRKSREAQRTGGVFMPMHPALWAVLKEYHPRGATGLVMPELAGVYERDRTALTKRIREVFEACEIETKRKVDGRKLQAVEVGFHSLRYSCASEMMKQGISVSIVQKLLGHATPQMTQKYFKLDPATARNAVNSLPCVGDVQTHALPLPAPANALQANVQALVEAHGVEAVRDALNALSAAQ